MPSQKQIIQSYQNNPMQNEILLAYYLQQRETTKT